MANSIQSLPVEIPPQPTKVKPVPLASWATIFKALKEIGFNGLPLKPPAWFFKPSPAFKVSGLAMVVLETMIPSILELLAEATIDFNSTSDKSGAILTRIGGLWSFLTGNKAVPWETCSSLFLTMADNKLVNLASFCKSLKPGVFGEETLITKTSAYFWKFSTPFR